MKESFIAWCLSLWGLLTIGFLLLNVITFFTYGLDKWKAKHGSGSRISEKTLLTLAAVGGSIGAIFGMNVWRHKTLHKKFSMGLPAILIVQIVLIGGWVIYFNYFC